MFNVMLTSSIRGCRNSSSGIFSATSIVKLRKIVSRDDNGINTLVATNGALCRQGNMSRLLTGTKSASLSNA